MPDRWTPENAMERYTLLDEQRVLAGDTEIYFKQKTAEEVCNSQSFAQVAT